MSDKHDERAERLLPCEHIVDQPGYYNDPTICFCCSKRPALAAEFRADAEKHKAEAESLKERLSKYEML